MKNSSKAMMEDVDAFVDADPKDVLFLAGGLSLLVLGAGLIMTSPGIRRTIMSAVSKAAPDLTEPLKAGISGLLPDVERYMKIRSM